jgi:NAD(P)-dependent dehydrogenase (short-subunit alcohol dehydrogenase family)
VITELAGRVAVITGGASGIGRAMGERFAAESMKVVLADIDEALLARTVDEVGRGGHDVIGIPTDVTDYASVERLRDEALDAFGAIDVLCNNAGVGAGAQGHLWDHTLNDWSWGLAVNLWGVLHGIKAFVPTMLAQGTDGHVVNTTSGNGGIAPLPSTAIYATTKSAVTTVTEVLYAQLRDVDAKIGASLLYPGPNMLRTGLFGSAAKRPAKWANETARTTPPPSIEAFEQRMAAAGVTLTYTPVEEVANQVVDAIRADQFWILPESQRTDERIEARARSMRNRTNPDYLEDLA